MTISPTNTIPQTAVEPFPLQDKKPEVLSEKEKEVTALVKEVLEEIVTQVVQTTEKKEEKKVILPLPKTPENEWMEKPFGMAKSALLIVARDSGQLKQKFAATIRNFDDTTWDKLRATPITEATTMRDLERPTLELINASNEPHEMKLKSQEEVTKNLKEFMETSAFGIVANEVQKEIAEVSKKVFGALSSFFSWG